MVVGSRTHMSTPNRQLPKLSVVSSKRFLHDIARGDYVRWGWAVVLQGSLADLCTCSITVSPMCTATMCTSTVPTTETSTAASRDMGTGTATEKK